MMMYAVILTLFLVGLLGVLVHRNLIKITIGVNIMEASLLLLLVHLALRPGDRAPIESGTGAGYADPIPHALALTAIVIGASTTAMLLSFIIKIHRHYGSVELDEIQGKKP